MSTKNRHTSFNFSPDAQSVICHSAIHRDAYRLSSNATDTVFPKNGNPYQRPHKSCREAFRRFWYWSKQEQVAIDHYIEAIYIGTSLDYADKVACIASRPDWIFSERKRKGFEAIHATRKDGELALHHSADNWRELHLLTR